MKKYKKSTSHTTLTCTRYSLSLSSALVASSRHSRGGLAMMARAMARRCLCPPDSSSPGFADFMFFLDFMIFYHILSLFLYKRIFILYVFYSCINDSNSSVEKNSQTDTLWIMRTSNTSSFIASFYPTVRSSLKFNSNINKRIFISWLSLYSGSD